MKTFRMVKAKSQMSAECQVDSVESNSLILWAMMSCRSSMLFLNRGVSAWRLCRIASLVDTTLRDAWRSWIDSGVKVGWFCWPALQCS